MSAHRLLCVALIVGITTGIGTTPAVYAATTYAPYSELLTAEQTRQVRASNIALAKELDLTEALIEAIANQLGLKTPKSQFGYARFIGDIRKQASDAKLYKGKIKLLEAEVLVLKDVALRTPALQALQRAQKAFEEGRLSDAEAEFGRLAFLRNAESENARDLWMKAIEAQADMAMLQLDEDRATALWDQAEVLAAGQEQSATLNRWRAAINAADAQYIKGKRLVDFRAIVDAQDRYVNKVLPIVPKGIFPEHWADTKNSLGSILRLRAQRVGGDAEIVLLDDAAKAYEDALTVFTKANARDDWAGTLNNLGNVLRRQGQVTGGEKGVAFLIKAERAYRDALTVFSEAKDPVEWAAALNNLCIVLRVQGEGLGVEAGSIFLADAATACEDALRVRTKSKMPFDWAMTSNNLGNVFRMQGQFTSGEAGTALLAKAVIAYEDVLTVRTKSETPADWAETQYNLGSVRLIQSQRSGEEMSSALLTNAATAFKNALTVFTKTEAPADWAGTLNLLGNVLRSQGKRDLGEVGTTLLNNAIIAYNDALTVYIQSEAPLDWAFTHVNLGITFQIQGKRIDGDAGIALLIKAANAYEDALRIYKARNFSSQIKFASDGLDYVRELIAERRAAPK